MKSNTLNDQIQFSKFCARDFLLNNGLWLGRPIEGVRQQSNRHNLRIMLHDNMGDSQPIQNIKIKH